MHVKSIASMHNYMYNIEELMYKWDTSKPGPWTLDWTMDWTVDWSTDDPYQFSVAFLDG